MSSNMLVSLATAGFAVLSVSAQAAGGAVSENQLNQVRQGQTQASVIHALGQPLNAPRWMDGTHSLVYAVSDSDESTERAYIDLGADNRVLNVQFSDDGEEN